MAILVVPWDNHNRVVGDTGPYAIRDHAPITASQNRREKAQIVGWDSSSPTFLLMDRCLVLLIIIQ